MSYKSDVRITISKKGYNKMIEYLENYIKEKELDRNEILELLNSPEINYENKFQKYIGWNDLKWYDSYPDITAINAALSYIENEGYSYKFTRIGENLTDIEEYGCDGDKDTKKNLYVDYPYIERGFDDVQMKNSMINQTKEIEKIKDKCER